MKLTNKQVVEGLAGLQALGRIKLPVRTAYAVAKATKKLADEAKPVTDVLNKLQDTYAEKDAHGMIKTIGGNQLSIPPAVRKNYDAEWTELMGAQTDDITGLRMIKFEEFAGMSIEPEILVAIDWMLDEPEPTKPDVPAPGPTSAPAKKD